MTTAKLIAKFAEPNLPGHEVLIAKSGQDWIIRTVKTDGNNPSWSAWMSLSERELRNTILKVHLGLTDQEANAIVAGAK